MQLVIMYGIRSSGMPPDGPHTNKQLYNELDLIMVSIGTRSNIVDSELCTG